MVNLISSYNVVKDVINHEMSSSVVFNRLTNSPSTRQGEDGRGVVSAVRRLGPEVGRFIWIMSDGVSPLSDLKELEDVAAGSFFIQVGGC